MSNEVRVTGATGSQRSLPVRRSGNESINFAKPQPFSAVPLKRQILADAHGKGIALSGKEQSAVSVSDIAIRVEQCDRAVILENQRGPRAKAGSDVWSVEQSAGSSANSSAAIRDSLTLSCSSRSTVICSTMGIELRADGPCSFLSNRIVGMPLSLPWVTRVLQGA